MQSDTQSKQTLSAADLAQFTGSEEFFRHSLNRSVLYSEGAHTSPNTPAPTGSWTKSPSPNLIGQP
jgi:hypothetical protein